MPARRLLTTVLSGVVLPLVVAVGSTVIAPPASASVLNRTSGLPTSANGASSAHLWLDQRGDAGASATVTVVRPPVARSVYFWALQVSFVDAKGAPMGGAHLGLQWHPSHPGSTAVNFGGYGRGGTELRGSASPLPSATRNPNTRNFAWKASTAYRLSIVPVAGGFAGKVTDVSTGRTTTVRTLYTDARIAGSLVFSEVFAPCDAPSTSVRWSDLGAKTVVATYQAVTAGGCTNTDHRIDGAALVQTTNSRRLLPNGVRLIHKAGPPPAPAVFVRG